MLKVLPYTTSMERFASGISLILEYQGEERMVVIDTSQPMGKFVLLSLKKHSTIFEVEPYSGCLIWAEKQNVGDNREADEYYVYELFNLKVIENDHFQGIIQDVVEGPAYDYLQIKKDEREFVLPFIRAFIKEVNLKAGYIMVSCPEGFWE